jgi:hypothetical protein
MSRIRHPNLVALLGFSTDGPELLLVYELMQNGSLYDQLHGMNQSLPTREPSEFRIRAGRCEDNRYLSDTAITTQNLLSTSVRNQKLFHTKCLSV